MQLRLSVQLLVFNKCNGFLRPASTLFIRSFACLLQAGVREKAKIHFDDIHLDRDYMPWTAYGQSKLANILFTVELAKRLKGFFKLSEVLFLCYMYCGESDFRQLVWSFVVHIIGFYAFL